MFVEELNLDMINENKPPILCAGAIVWRGDTLLLVQRAQAPSIGSWTFPGGRAEPGEAMATAALRELYEETGVCAVIAAALRPIFLSHQADNYKVHNFAARWQANEPLAGDDAAGARFVSASDLPEYNLTQQVLDAAALARRLL